MALWELLKTGGVTILILIGCSIISVGIIIERCIYYRMRSRIKREEFMLYISDELEKGRVNSAIEICESTDAPFSEVVQIGLSFAEHEESVIESAMERGITTETVKLEKIISIVGTIGSTAVYIGLFGTVLGIIRAFGDISKSGSGGMSVVVSGISEALICTAAGLCVAVPAVIAYNYFIKRVDGFVTDMELCASETLDLLISSK